MSFSFGRVVELYVNNRRFSGNDFTIKFNVKFDDSGEVNVSDIKIYNLKTDTINAITNDSKIVLNAGYKGDAGAILLGVVKDVKTAWSGVDCITTMQVLDGTDAWFSMPLKKTYAENSTARDILADITKMTGLQIGALNLPSNRVYKSGKTINGALSAIIKDVAKDCGAKAHVTRGKVFIRPENEGDGIGFVLDAEHGLVSSPTPIEKEETIRTYGAERKAKIVKKGWSVKCLLNHKITTDAIIRISSKTANGIFRVSSGKHNGESFETEMEVWPV